MVVVVVVVVVVVKMTLVTLKHTCASFFFVSFVGVDVTQ